MPSKPPASLAAALRNTFQLYQYILNSPDVMIDSPQPTGEVSKVLRKFFGSRNKKAIQEFLQAVEATQSLDVEVALFSRFLHDIYDTDDLTFFLHGWSKVMAIVFADPNVSKRGPEHTFLKWAKLGPDTCTKLAYEIFDEDQWEGEPFWWAADGRPEAAVPAFNFLASALSEYRILTDKPPDGLTALRVHSTNKSPKAKSLGMKQLGQSGGRSAPNRLELDMSLPEEPRGSESGHGGGGESNSSWASSKRVDALAREMKQLHVELNLQNEHGLRNESDLWGRLTQLEASVGAGGTSGGAGEKKVLQMLESQDARLEEFEQLILDQQAMFVDGAASSTGEPPFGALVEKQLRIAEERLGKRLEARIDQLLAASNGAPPSTTVDTEMEERVSRLEARLDQTWEAIEKLKSERHQEPEEVLRMVIEHEERLSRHERDLACLGSRSRGGSGVGNTNSTGNSQDISRVEARMRTELNKRAKNNDEKIDGALRKVAHLSQRFDSELGCVEAACKEFQELAALLSHKVGANCEDIQALDQSTSSLQDSLSSITEASQMDRKQVSDVQEELQQLEARLSVLADQYSGTTEMYSSHMDQNTAIVDQLALKVEKCSIPGIEMVDGLKVQLDDLKFQFEEMTVLTQQGSNAVSVLEEKLQQSLGESAIKVEELESRVDQYNKPLVVLESPLENQIEGLNIRMDQLSSSNAGYHEATSQLMATVADLQEMQHSLGGKELVVASQANQLVTVADAEETQNRLKLLEKTQKQLGYSCRTLKESLNRSCRDMLSLSVNQLKEEAAAEEKKIKSQVNSKIKANAQQTDRRFGEFEEKLLSRVAEIISSLQASKAEADLVSKLEGRMQTLETWGTPSDKRLRGMQEKLDELESSLKTPAPTPAAPPPLPPPPPPPPTLGTCDGCAATKQQMDKLSMTIKTKFEMCDAKSRKHDDRMQAMLLKLNKRCSETEEAIELLTMPKSHIDEFSSPKRSMITSPTSVLSPEIA